MLGSSKSATLAVTIIPVTSASGAATPGTLRYVSLCLQGVMLPLTKAGTGKGEHGVGYVRYIYPKFVTDCP